ncbi:MAG: hypothetical protein EOO53_14470 [Gammaproteobacteria bacterium]|nr:MAG: hypothetical protein EOO53_14470 [Gammaproteobacteria bacterium]
MLKKFFIYGCGNVLAGIIPFLLLPYLTSHLSPAQMGSVGFIESIIMLVSPLVIFGADGSYCSFYNKHSSSGRELLLASLIQLSTMIALCFIPVLLVVSFFNLLPIQIDTIWILSLFAVFLSMAINALACAHFQMEEQALAYVVYKVVGIAVTTVITLFAISQWQMGAEGRLLGIYLGPFFLALGWLICLIMQKDLKLFQFHVEFIKKGFHFGFGMLLHSWSAVIFFASDRVIIGYLLGSDTLGQYVVASQIGMIMALVQNTFSQVWTPHTFKLFSRSSVNEFSLQSKFAVALLFISTVILMLLVPVLYKYFIDDRYTQMKSITYWVIATYFFLGVYKVYVVKLFYAEKTKELAKITTFCSVFNVIITFFFVMKWGVAGGAIATFLSSIVFAALVYYRGRSYGKTLS